MRGVRLLLRLPDRRRLRLHGRPGRFVEQSDLGIGIIAVILVSLLILGFGSIEGGLLDRQNGKLAIALALFTTSVVLAIAAISNDNLQDLKTGYLVGATPWRQQVALIVGCIVGALVIPRCWNCSTAPTATGPCRAREWTPARPWPRRRRP